MRIGLASGKDMHPPGRQQLQKANQDCGPAWLRKGYGSPPDPPGRQQLHETSQDCGLAWPSGRIWISTRSTWQIPAVKGQPESCRQSGSREEFEKLPDLRRQMAAAGGTLGLRTNLASGKDKRGFRIRLANCSRRIARIACQSDL